MLATVRMYPVVRKQLNLIHLYEFLYKNNIFHLVYFIKTQTTSTDRNKQRRRSATDTRGAYTSVAMIEEERETREM